MLKRMLVLWLIIILLAPALPASAQTEPVNFQVETLMREGTQHLFAFQFEDARAKYNEALDWERTQGTPAGEKLVLQHLAVLSMFMTAHLATTAWYGDDDLISIEEQKAIDAAYLDILAVIEALIKRGYPDDAAEIYRLSRTLPGFPWDHGMRSIDLQETFLEVRTAVAQKLLQLVDDVHALDDSDWSLNFLWELYEWEAGRSFSPEQSLQLYLELLQAKLGQGDLAHPIVRHTCHPGWYWSFTEQGVSDQMRADVLAAYQNFHRLYQEEGAVDKAAQVLICQAHVLSEQAIQAAGAAQVGEILPIVADVRTLFQVAENHAAEAEFLASIATEVSWSDPERAFSLWQAILDIAQKEADWQWEVAALAKLGAFYQKNDDYAEAVASYEGALDAFQIDPYEIDHFPTHFHFWRLPDLQKAYLEAQVSLFLDTGRLDEAVNVQEELAVVDDLGSYSRWQLALLYEEIGETQKAALLYEEIGDLQKAASLYAANGEQEEAAVLWLRIARQAKNRFNFSQVEQDWQEAADAYRLLLRLPVASDVPTSTLSIATELAALSHSITVHSEHLEELVESGDVRLALNEALASLLPTPSEDLTFSLEEISHSLLALWEQEPASDDSHTLSAIATLYMATGQPEKAAGIWEELLLKEELIETWNEETALEEQLAWMRTHYAEKDDGPNQTTALLRLCANAARWQWRWQEVERSSNPLAQCQAALPLLAEYGMQPKDVPAILTIMRHRHQLPAEFSADLSVWSADLLPIYNRLDANLSVDITFLNRARMIEGLAHLTQSAGHHDQALGLYHQALIENEEAGNEDARSYIYEGLTKAHANLGQFSEQLTTYQKWHQLAQVQSQQSSLLDDVFCLATSSCVSRVEFHELLNSVENLAFSQGRYEEALALSRWAESVAWSRYMQATNDLVVGAYGVGGPLGMAGEGHFVVSYQQPVLDQLRTQIDTLSLLGEYEESLASAEKAFNLLFGDDPTSFFGMTRSSTRLLVEARAEMGALQAILQQPRLALARYKEARDLILTVYPDMTWPMFRTPPMSDLVLESFQGVASSYTHLGQADMAFYNLYGSLLYFYMSKFQPDAPNLPLALQSLLQNQTVVSSQENLLIAQVLTNLGDYYQMNNLDSLMADIYQSALFHYNQYLQQSPDQDQTRASVLVNIGAIQDRLGNPGQAVTSFKEAIEITESIQGNLRVEQWKTSYIGDQSDIYTRLIDLLWRENQIAEAFAYAERAQARVFLDQIGNARIDFFAGASPERVAAEQQVSQSIIGLQNALQMERDRPLDLQDEEQIAAWQTELEEKQGEHARLLDQLRAQNPEYVSLVSVETLDLEGVQSQILGEGDTTLIEYMVLDEHVLAWVLNGPGSEVVLVSLSITAEELVRQVGFLQRLVGQGRFDEGRAAQLHAALFAPLMPHIEHENVILVLHGPLHYLPFAALYNGETGRYLVEDYTLTYAPSASVLRFIQEKRNPNSGRVMVMGNPDGSLPHAETEARQVAALYQTQPLLRTEATEERVHAEAGAVDIWHIAAHGVYNPFAPLSTRIELAVAPDAPHDGFLTVAEVYGLDLSEANLVVLSACESDGGEISDGGDVVGLTRAFLYAGAPSVVTTLWKIDDAASGALMEQFHANLQSGVSVAAALQVAQQSVLDSEEWSSPYYWAAFRLTGDALGSLP